MNNQQVSKNKNTAKIGLFSSITILISAVVGIGIFFKNKSVLGNNSLNGYGVLISWVVAAIITLTTALAFAEIISADKKHNGSGLAGWAKIICGHKVGRFILIALPMFYFLFKLVDTSFFASESVLIIFNQPDISGGVTTMTISQDTWIIVLVAYAIMLLFIGINAFSTKAGKIISVVATVAKFLPLIVVGVLGIVFGAMSGWSGNFFTNITQHDGGSNEILPLGIFASLPALLFTFDSFLTIGNAASSMNNPQKDVPRAILIGIPIITFLYLFVTIGQLVTGQRDVYAFFNYIVTQCHGGPAAAQALNIIVGCVIMISLFGSMNAFALTAIRSLQSAIDDEIIIGSVTFKKLANGRHLRAGALYGASIATIVAAVMAIPIITLNSDSAYDGVSNLPTLFFFMIYALVVFFGLINHYTHKVEVKRMKIFPLVAIIAVTGCAFAFGYNLFYEFTARNFVNTGPVNWGMFKGQSIDRWIASILVWAFLIIFIALPFINDLCIKLFRKNHNQRLIWM